MMAETAKTPDPRRTKAFRELCKLAGKAIGTYGRFADAAKYIDPRKE